MTVWRNKEQEKYEMDAIAPILTFPLKGEGTY